MAAVYPGYWCQVFCEIQQLSAQMRGRETLDIQVWVSFPAHAEMFIIPAFFALVFIISVLKAIFWRFRKIRLCVKNMLDLNSKFKLDSNLKV